MKKKLILFLGISLLFFSCASTNVEKTDDVEETDNIENLQTTENDETQEVQEENEQNQELISEQYPELEDLTEPEITDLEWQEEQKNEDDEETNPEENTELVENEEELSPIEELQPIETENQTEEENPTENQTDENIENQTENDENLQENSNDESFSENNYEDDEIIDLTEDDSDDDIIEILEDSSDSTPEENVEPIIIVPSRKVTLNIGQTLEVLYPGSGWIYMGTTDNTKDFSFLGKKLGTENTKFTFKAKKQGNKILHFYKNDILTQNYIDDYLEVEILSEKDSSNKTIQAPEYKQPVPKKLQTEITETKTQNEDSQITQNDKTNQTTNESISSSKTQNSSNSDDSSSKTSTSVNQTANDSSSDSTSTEENQQNQNENNDEITEIDTTALLEEAESLYNEKNYKDALSKLETYIEYSKDNRDKALYLQGQIYETDGEYKNVKKAIESYKTLTKNYPASSYWDSANKRIIYLTKFYLEGR